MTVRTVLLLEILLVAKPKSGIAPAFVEGLKGVEVEDGSQVSLKVVVKGDPSPGVKWFYQGAQLKSSEDFQLVSDGDTHTLLIAEIFPEDEGEYSCRLSNAHGQAESTALLTVKEEQSGPGVQEPPRFTLRPKALTLEESGSAVLVCRVEGHPVPTVEWQKDNCSIALSHRIKATCGESGEHLLRITTALSTDSGNYTCVAVNSAGREQCTVPMVVRQIKEEQTDFRSLLKSNPKLHKLDSTSSEDSWEAEQLDFRHVLKSPQSKTPTQTSVEDMVRKKEPEQLDFRHILKQQQQQQQQQPKGNGVGPPKDLPNARKAEQLDFRHILKSGGGPSSALEKPSPKKQEAEQCNFRNVLKKHVETNAKPVLAKKMADVEVKRGQRGVLECHVKGSPLPTIAWFNRKRVEIDEDYPRSVVPLTEYDGAVASLIFERVLPEDEGTYTCRANNISGEAEACAYLMVLDVGPDLLPNGTEEEAHLAVSAAVTTDAEPVAMEEPSSAPQFRVPLEDEALIEGGTVRLQCAVTGQPEPDIYWYKDGMDIRESSKYQVEFLEEDLVALLIQNAGIADVGTYSCKAVNEAGQTKCSAKLIFEASPKVIKGPHSLQAVEGQSIRIECQISGTPPPRVTWFKGKKELAKSARVHLTVEQDVATLTIPVATHEDSGSYRLMLESQLGHDSHTAAVSVAGCPDPPAGKPTVCQVTSTSLTLSWSGTTYDGGSIVTAYSVEQSSRPEDWRLVTSTRSTSHKLSGLQPHTQYRFRVRAENVHGLSQPSALSEPVVTSDTLPSTNAKSDPVEAEVEENESEIYNRIVTLRNDKTVRDLYHLKEEIGKGRFGTVYKCVEKSTNKTWAAKYIKVKLSEKEAVKKEISIMNELQHPKLLQCADAFETNREIVMILEYISGGELFERVIDDDYILTEKEVIGFTRQICEGMEHMHQKNILHLDLKPENIMCVSCNSNRIKLIDFGLARKYDPKETLKEMVGTPEFVAPEVINFEPLSFATDMWSLGVICYVLLSGLSPFMGENDPETLSNVTAGEWDFEDEAFDNISDDAKDFIEKLLVKRKEKRFTVVQCLQHKWLVKDTNTMEAKQISTAKLKKYVARKRWQKTTNAVRAIGRMASLTMFSSLKKATNSQQQSKGGLTPFSDLLKAKRESAANGDNAMSEAEPSRGSEVADINHNGSQATAKGNLVHVTKKTVLSTFNSSLPGTKKSTVEEEEVEAEAAARGPGARPKTMPSARTVPLSPRGTPPHIVKEMRDCEVFEGDLGRFDCLVAGSPEPEVQWLQDGLPIEESQHFLMECGEDGTYSLVIADVTEDDDAEYTLEASNALGKASCTAELIVELTGSD